MERNVDKEVFPHKLTSFKVDLINGQAAMCEHL